MLDVSSSVRSSTFAGSLETTVAHPKGDCRDTVLLLTSRLGMGGAERHAITLANLLNRRFRIVVAYLKPEEDMLGQLDQQPLLEVRCLRVAKRVDRRAARDLAELAKVHGARLIVCANAFALMYAHIARAYSATPLTVMEIFHTTKLRTMKERLELLFYRPFFWAAQYLVFVCDGQRKYWSRRGLWAREVRMIYNGVDLLHFDAAVYGERAAAMRESLGFRVDDRVIGICAVLRPEKAHTDLLKAVAQLRRAEQQWRILIIGDGPMRRAIEQEIDSLGLSASTRITGFKSDVREFLAACDAVALVSTAIETFSIAALEAMAMAKPMIMSDVGGAREQVTHGIHGLLFPPGDVAALATCLRQCWDQSACRQMGLAARRRVELQFSQQAMIDQYDTLFSAIFSAGRQDMQSGSR